ncbi:MAG: nucleotidyltransferase family protein [Acidobacteriota bacterium]|nr:nucleotidyltransferase family protein [Acidobacteriota bacterium]
MNPTFQPGSPAARWLLAVCSGHAPEQWPAWPRGQDGYLLAMARAHRLAARAGGRLAAHGQADSPGAGDLVAAWRRGVGEQGLFCETLGELDRRAVQQGVRLIVLKGADLCQRIYPPGERTSNDIDLLVRPEQLDQAEAVLAAAGFICDHPDPLDARRHWFASTYRSQIRPRLQVDLHWALGARHRTHWKLDAVFARAEAQPGLAAVGRLALEDLLVFLALHAVAFHGALARWVWWLDMYLLLQTTGVQPREVLERARDVGGAVALGAAMTRVERLFGGGFPGRWGGPSIRGRWIEALSAEQERAGPGGWRRRLVAALSVDRPRDLLALAAWAGGRAWRRRRRQGGKPAA